MITWHARVYNLRKYRPTTAYRIKLCKSGTRRSPGGSRDMGEWVDLLRALETAHVVIYVTSHGRYYDPANGRDRRALLEDAIDSEFESFKKSQGVKRAMDANARDGRPHGHTPFGYKRVYEDRKLIRQDIEPAEASIVREIYDRLNAGESLRAIEHDFESRNILTRAGKRFSAQAIRLIAMNPAYMGKRSHTPVTDTRDRTRVDPDTLTDAQWPAIVDSGLWWEVHNRLADPARRTSKPGASKHLLSILARCGVCGGPLTASFRYKGKRGFKTWQLVCQRASHVRIEEDALDAYVVNQIVAYLSKPENYTSGVKDTGELASLKGSIAELSQRRENLAVALAEGMDAGQVAKADKILAAKIADLQARERQISTPAALSGLVGPSNRQDDIRARWAAASLSARREVVRLVMGYRGTIHVLRHPNGGGLGVPASQRVEWREAT